MLLQHHCRSSQSHSWLSAKLPFIVDKMVDPMKHYLPFGQLSDTGLQMHEVGRDESDATQLEICPVEQKRKFVVRRGFVSIAICLLVILTPPCNHLETLGIKHHLSLSPPVYAAEMPVQSTGMACVAEYCSRPLSKCLSELKCAKGLGCFMNCAVNDALVSNKGSGRGGRTTTKAEGTCQVRCMDLYQNQLLDDFTDCSLTEHNCYNALKADDRYPPLPFDVWDSRLKQDLGSTKSTLKELFRGTWYISAGLNPTFDTFDCQKHQFFRPKNLQEESGRFSGTNKHTTIVADATFSYRIKKDDGMYFTKNGPKRLSLLLDGEGEIHHKELDSEEVFYQPNRKWGVDIYNHDGQSAHNQHSDPQQKYRLVLTLRPPSLDYEDDWTVLSFSNDPKYGYIVLAYRGTNAAWEGYGGLNVYTREPTSFVSISCNTDEKILRPKRETLMFEDIQSALGKVGLSFDDLLQVDNSCEK